VPVGGAGTIRRSCRPGPWTTRTIPSSLAPAGVGRFTARRVFSLPAMKKTPRNSKGRFVTKAHGGRPGKPCRRGRFFIWSRAGSPAYIPPICGPSHLGFNRPSRKIRRGKKKSNNGYRGGADGRAGGVRSSGTRGVISRCREKTISIIISKSLLGAPF